MTEKIKSCKRETWMGDDTEWCWDGYNRPCASKYKPVWDVSLKETHGSRWVAKNQQGLNNWVSSHKDFVKRTDEKQRRDSLRRIQ